MPWGAREASPIPPCKEGAGAAPWGARKASPIPSCEGGAGGAPWGAKEASLIPFCEGVAGAMHWVAREAFPTPLPAKEGLAQRPANGTVLLIPSCHVRFVKKDLLIWSQSLQAARPALVAQIQ